MKSFLSIVCIFLFPAMLAANSYPIIPKPRKLVEQKGSFILTPQTSLVVKGFEQEEAKSVVRHFAQQLSVATGWASLAIQTEATSNCIIWRKNEKIAPEGYRLNVSSTTIVIESSTTKGGFYALQSLRQLLPIQFESQQKNSNIQWSIPCCSIEDEPAFAYRGMMLDVCRHFASVEEVKTIIDQLALLKISTFHWHLTDDQGWRIEIKKYPRLTTIGGFRDRTLIGHYNDLPHRYDQKRVGGFYTQDEIREVVKYAADRFVDILPEIELPGHAVAALTAYPQYSCSGGPFEVGGKWGIFNDIYCSKEETFQFLEDILSEVTTLFPNKLVHIGGDEAPRIRWSNCTHCQQRIKTEGLKDENALQTYFIKRIEKFLNSKGKELIGWDEILDKGLAPSTTIMSWRGEKGGIAAAKMKHKVVMSPFSYVYFDYYQSQLASEPLAIGGYAPLERVYSYHPIPSILSKEEAKYIMGVQANVWTEYMPTKEHRQYMIFPRIAALAEVAWTPEKDRNYDEYSERLPRLLERYEMMGLNYSHAFYDITGNTIPKGSHLNLELSTKRKNGEIRYTTDGTTPTAASSLYKTPIPLGSALSINAMVFNGDKEVGVRYFRKFNNNKLAGSTISISKNPAPQYSGKGELTLIDCISGRYPIIGSEWLGYEGESVEIVVTLPDTQQLSSLTLGSTYQPGQRIYPPRHVEFFIADDKEEFRSIGQLKYDSILANNSKAKCTFTPSNVKKVKVVATNYGIIPLGNQGENHPARLFLDELIGE